VSWRFYRRFKLAPGLSLNLSRSGVSGTVGVRGLHLTRGKRGTGLTVGIPGTGLSYRETDWRRPAPFQAPAKGPPVLLVLAIVLFLILMWVA